MVYRNYIYLTIETYSKHWKQTKTINNFGQDIFDENQIPQTFSHFEKRYASNTLYKRRLLFNVGKLSPFARKKGGIT